MRFDSKLIFPLQRSSWGFSFALALGHGASPQSCFSTMQALEKTLNMDITRWSILNQTDYILCRQRWKSCIQSAKTRLGADCGSDHELLFEKFKFKLKEVGKIIRPFRSHLDQIPYDYRVEGTNRFKGLDLIERAPGELWTEVRNIVQEAVIKTIPKKKKCKKAKWLSEEALQIAERTEAKGKGEKERYTHLNTQFQRIARRDKKALISDQCKE